MVLCYRQGMRISTEKGSFSDYLERAPDVCRGRLRVRGTRIKVSELAWRHVYATQSPDEIVEALPQLTLAQIYAALAYYFDHRDEIDAEIRAEDEFVSRLEARYGARVGPT